MKKINLILFSVLCLFSLSFKVNAACNDEELNKWALNAYVEYEEDADLVDEDGNVLREKEYLYLLHLVPYYEKGKVMVKDSHSNKEYEVEYDELYDSYVLGSYLHMDEKTYTFTFYGSSNSSCPNQKLRTIEYKVPSYNVYSNSRFCLENPLEDICKTNSNDMKEVDDKEFVDTTNKKEEEQRVANMNFFEKALYYLKKNWYFIVIPIVLVSAFYVIRIYVYRKKVDKE